MLTKDQLRTADLNTCDTIECFDRKLARETGEKFRATDCPFEKLMVLSDAFKTLADQESCTC